MNDGIIWKHSSQYSGLMSIYLQGVCSSLPFYLSKHIWCPVAGASNRNVCFPEDACSLFIQFGALVWLCSVGKKRTSCQNSGDFSCSSGQGAWYCVISPVSLCVCVPVTKTQTIHGLSRERLKPPESLAAIPLVLQSVRTPVELTRATLLHSLKCAFTPTSNVTANPLGSIDCNDPYGSKGYIFMWQ